MDSHPSPKGYGAAANKKKAQRGFLPPRPSPTPSTSRPAAAAPSALHSLPPFFSSSSTPPHRPPPRPTTNKDGNGIEDDAAALLEDHKGDGEEDAATPLEDHGYGGEEDSANGDQDDSADGDQDDSADGEQDDSADGEQDDSSDGYQDDSSDGYQDDCGPVSEEYRDVPFAQRAVQLLAIRANFHVCAINGYDMQIGRCIYREHEGEVQEEGMVDLIPIGPCGVLMAHSVFTLEIFPSMTSNEGSTPITFPGYPFRLEWDVCDDVDDHIEPSEYTQSVYCGGAFRRLEITYLVIPKAIETTVEVKLKLKDLGSRSLYGKIKASTADYGNKSVHLFSCERARSWSVPSGPTSILPLSPDVIALPYRRQLELHVEVDLIVITIFDNQEGYKNLKFSLTFSREIRSQEREVDGDQVEVSIHFNPKI